jgi:large subunit ribosomal protein L28
LTPLLFTEKIIYICTPFEKEERLSNCSKEPSVKEKKMSKVCQLTGKRPISGNNVSHANNRTKRRFEPNLQKKRFFIPELNKWVTLRISTSALRTMNKLGVYEFLKKLESKGVRTGVELTKSK